MAESSEHSIKNFTDLIVWQKSHRLYLDTVEDLKANHSTDPGGRELADQLLRCVGSISANIAEGFGSDGAAEYCRYLTIARKSCAEAENWFLKAKGLGQMGTIEARVGICGEVSRMLYSLREKIKNRGSRGPAAAASR